MDIILTIIGCAIMYGGIALLVICALVPVMFIIYGLALVLGISEYWIINIIGQILIIAALWLFTWYLPTHVWHNYNKIAMLTIIILIWPIFDLPLDRFSRHCKRYEIPFNPNGIWQAFKSFKWLCF